MAATSVFVVDPGEAPLVQELCDDGGVHPSWLLWLCVALGKENNIQSSIMTTALFFRYSVLDHVDHKRLPVLSHDLCMCKNRNHRKGAKYHRGL